MADQFNYDSLFSANSRDAAPGNVRHSKYDFAVAYPDPANLPLEELIESVRAGFEREGRDLAYYSSPSGDPELRKLVAENADRGSGAGNRSLVDEEPAKRPSGRHRARRRTSSGAVWVSCRIWCSVTKSRI